MKKLLIIAVILIQLIGAIHATIEGTKAKIRYYNHLQAKFELLNHYQTN